MILYYRKKKKSEKQKLANDERELLRCYTDYNFKNCGNNHKKMFIRNKNYQKTFFQ